MGNLIEALGIVLSHSGLRRRRPVGLVLAVALVGSLAVLLIACGGGTSATSTTSPGARTYAPAITGTAAGDIAQLNWALPTGEPPTLDPPIATYLNADTLLPSLVDTLGRRTPDGKIVPNVASSWTYSADHKTLVLKIRDDVKFWDGNPLTAEDVVFSLERDAGPNSYVGIFFNGVKSIEATGTYEVTIRFKPPSAFFINNLAHNACSGILEKAWVEKMEKAGKVVGSPGVGLMASGPFKLEKWTPGQSIELVRNDNYWNPEFRAHAAKVTVRFIEDSAALAQALSAGEVDGAWEVAPAVIPTLRSSTTGTLYLGKSRQYFTFGACTPNGPVSDQKLREAINRSVDREAIAKVVFNGAGIPNYSTLNSGTIYPETQNLWDAMFGREKQAYSYDLDAAKQLVKESSYAGQKLTVYILSGNTTEMQVAQLIQEGCKAIGVNLAIKPLTSVQYNTAQTSAEAMRKYDFYMSTSYNGSPDPLEPLMFNVLPDSYYNYVEYNDPNVTALFNEAIQTFDVTKRTKLLIQANETYDATQWYTTLVDLDEVCYLNNKLTGMVTTFNYENLPSLALIGAKQ